MKACVLTLLLSMIPVAELRAAIPFGVAQGLPLLTAVLLSVAGTMLPVPFIILFVRAVFRRLRKRSARLDALVTRLEGRALQQGGMVCKYGLIGLCILVAVPLPGTGAWTGSLVAAVWDMRLRRAFPAIFFGVCIAAFIVGCVTAGAVLIV